MTSGRFVADPFGAPGDRIYRTGDVVRWTSGLEIEYVGRSDSQVKVRGFRIELGEIESALVGCAGVARAVVVVRKVEHLGDRIVAYVVPESGAALESSAVSEEVGQFLTAYMVPDAVVVIDAIPLTHAGKTDVRALPDPIFESRTHRAPATEMERIVAGLFAEVLRLDEVSADDSFFALGGDSIMSIQLVSRAKTSGIVFSPRDVFEHKTVVAIAEVARHADVVEEIVLEELEVGNRLDADDADRAIHVATTRWVQPLHPDHDPGTPRRHRPLRHRFDDLGCCRTPRHVAIACGGRRSRA
ncbi:hypothetical protein QV65_10165 [Rhodococcus erythropolis]|nr:hypothetical protein QV65_10165 [Rhodococcus erythropolis]